MKSTTRNITVVLWIAVIVAIAIVLWNRNSRTESPAAITVPLSGNSNLQETSWSHLPHVSTFELTDQTGQPFPSSQLAGRPYVVSFFFASCSTRCKELNAEVQRLAQQFRNEDITFVSITCDPETDTPEVLHEYAELYGADSQKWVFLTGDMYKIKEIGQQWFQVVIDKETHNDDLLLIDRWGRYRDRFKWDEPEEIKRFRRVLREVSAEDEPPLNKTVTTRNLLAGVEPPLNNLPPWIREFHLTDQNGDKFFSRDFTGSVWVGSFFFSTCPGICPRQNSYLNDLARELPADVRLVSITTRPTTDTPAKLRQYMRQFDAADGVRWKFLTGDETLIRRIGAEFFAAQIDGEHHSSRLFVVDRWGNVRGRFDWQQDESKPEMRDLIGELRKESQPPAIIEIHDHSS